MSYENPHSLTPLDNRYINRIRDVSAVFSDLHFTKIKTMVECEYLKFILKTLNVATVHRTYMSQLLNIFMDNFDNGDYERIKEIEKTTNHDIQAIVVYLMQSFPRIKEYVHFGLTSQDINSPAMVYSYKLFNETILLPELDELIKTMDMTHMNHNKTVMLTFTHGQPATPTTVSHQFAVFLQKINTVYADIKDYEYYTKMGGSNGCLTSLKCSNPEIDWDSCMNDFVELRLGMKRNSHTTQIDDYLNYCKLFQTYQRLCLVLTNFCSDIWLYCSKRYFRMNNVKGEVGSSAMPHKINPIQFENAEGNLRLAYDLFESIGRNICSNRLQRDLTDSTILRNVGLTCGHLILAVRNIIAGLKRIEVNSEVIKADLIANNVVAMEFIQMKMRQLKIKDGYELCKEFARGKQSFSFDEFRKFLQDKGIGISSGLNELLKTDIERLILGH